MPPPTARPPRRPGRPALEVAAVIASGLLHLLPLEALFPHVYLIAGLSLAWLAYAVRCILRHATVPATWGLRRQGLRPTTAAAGAFVLVATAALAAVVWSTELRDRAIPWDPGMLAVLVLYPLWGLVQQLLVQAMVARNLRPTLGPVPVTLICAALFGLVHVPRWPLVACTFAMGLVFTPVYLRWRNLWPLGLFHGWLGVPAYYWLLGEDPLRTSLG